MNIPVVPMLQFLADLNPSFVGVHQVTAWFGASMFALGGLYQLVEWAPKVTSPISDDVRAKIYGGFFLLVAALACIVFGAYMIIPMIGYLIWQFGPPLVKAFAVLLGRYD